MQSGMKEQKPTEVSQLLRNSQGTLKKLQDAALAASRTLEVVRACLPEPLGAEVWGASVRGQTLTLLVTSAAWGTRIRFQAAALREALEPGPEGRIARVVVRVRPAAGR
ncbi:MAG: DciA family protein [Steroidobacteraceae bacterium]